MKSSQIARTYGIETNRTKQTYVCERFKLTVWLKPFVCHDLHIYYTHQTSYILWKSMVEAVFVYIVTNARG